MQWLDLARYADTHGYHIDSHRDMWKWREWVIDSFNQNQPFDKFIIEQLAGDLLPNPTTKQILATGLQRNHMINFEGGAIPEEYQNEYVVDRVETAAIVFMGMTMGCARCHDHKYDPISQKDFYRFGAFFNTIPEKGLDGTKGNAEPMLQLPTATQAERDKYVKERTPEVEKALDSAAVKDAYATWQKTAKFAADPRQGLLAITRWMARSPTPAATTVTGSHSKTTSTTSRPSVAIARPSSAGAVKSNSPSSPSCAKDAQVQTIALWFQTNARTFKNGILYRTDSDRRGWSIELDDPFAVPRMIQQARIVLRKVESWPDKAGKPASRLPSLFATKATSGCT